MPFRGLNRVGVQIPDRHGKGIFWGLYGPMNSLGITTPAFHAARKINNYDIRTAAAGDKALAWPVSQNIFPCREQNPHFAMRPVVKILSLLVFNLTRTWAVAYPRIILHAICVDLHCCAELAIVTLCRVILILVSTLNPIWICSFGCKSTLNTLQKAHCTLTILYVEIIEGCRVSCLFLKQSVTK